MLSRAAMLRRFHLTRVYSIASLIGIGLVAIALSWFYRSVSVNALLAHETQANVAIAQAMANTLWPQHAAFVSSAARLPHDQLATHPEIAMLDRDVRQKIRGLNIVKVKIYNLDGLTVYSSESRQIGEDKSGNPGFLRARHGEVASELVYRDHFSAFEQVIENRNVLSSYIPIGHATGGAVEGIFEVYSDVTPLVYDARRTGYIVVGVVTGLSLLLYTFLLVIVRRADRIIRRHEDEERQMQREQIRHLAYHDVLTGLANRAQFKDRLQHAIAMARRENKAVGLMFLDLDRFKVVNDSLGHESGDQVLIETSARIRACVRQVDTVCRTGGDEFIVILESLSEPQEAEVVARRLIQAFVPPMPVANREVVVSPSIGIAIFPGATRDPGRLLSDADAAMRHAKAGGRGRYVFYSAELDARARQDVEYELALRNALANREFVVHYQPRMDLAAGTVQGFEALLRWQRPGRPLIQPNDFVPLLEDTGLIVPVGEWVIREACRQCRLWQDAGYRDLRVAVNLSPRQFRSDSLARTVRDALTVSGLPAHSLEFELTESVLVDDTEQAARQLRELKEIGVRVSIDDFGVGYSSLSYLRQFPIDFLKIDRSFVRDVPDSADAAALAAAITAMAHSLKLGVIAEGVENWEQAQFLRSVGCHLMQGFLFARPLPVPECERLLASDILRLVGHHPPARGQQDASGTAS
jgi:diguanylate cyclase (GGDEF)-like protein